MAELQGLKELNAKLARLGAKTGAKVLRSAALKATTPVMRAMRAKIPVGTEAHRTHKGRLVAPGFLKRSLRRKTRLFRRTGTAVVTLGVRSEAFYGPQFLDQGPWRISSRRISTGRRSTKKVAIKPYTLRKRPFFESVFIANRRVMESKLAEELKKNIEAAVRGNNSR